MAKGVLLGLGAAVPIGPVNVQIARLALRHGFVPAFCLGCGAVTVDVSYAVLAAVGVERILRSNAIDVALRLSGAVLLAYLGAMCLRSEREAWRSDPIGAGKDLQPTRTAGRSYVVGLLMTLLNPMTLAFWFVAVPALAGPVGAGERRNLPLVCSGVFAGTVTWVVVFAGVLALAGRLRRNWWLAAADAAGGAAMLVFAVVALLSSLRPFL
ncbi:MAG TPA: LysE family transporter [Longimicrobium sp.]|nr:LysE family transporter [Longimicrobium sp.]